MFRAKEIELKERNQKTNHRKIEKKQQTTDVNIITTLPFIG